MVTIIQHPSAVSFAGNPVLLIASSSLSNKTFLKICAEVAVSVYQKETLIDTVTIPLSLPTSGSGQGITFDLSNPLLSALSQVTIERNVLIEGTGMSETGGYVEYSVKCWDEYLNEEAEVVSSKDSAAQSETRVAIPGAYTDLQRLLKPEDTESFLGREKILSNKPDFEAIPVGGKLVVPMFCVNRRFETVYMDTTLGKNAVGNHNLYANQVSWTTLTIPETTEQGEHSLLWAGMDVPPFFFYAVPEQPYAAYFEFVNRLGAVESIYTYGRAVRKSSIKSERQVRKHSTSFRPNARYVKRVLLEGESLEFSTGPVSREWAQWFVSEFFASEHTWMYSEKAGCMVPVIIECEEDMEVFNETESEVLDLKFTVTRCINEGNSTRYI